MALLTLEGNASIPITATIMATWTEDHYEFVVSGIEDGIVGIPAYFLCEYKGTIEINADQIVLDDAITLAKLGVDQNRQCLLCRIENIE